MNNPLKTAVGSLVAAAGLAGCASGGSYEPFGELQDAPADALNETPNIVLFFVDDMGYGDVSCYGNTAFSTPNIDRLAEEGVRFTDFYVAQPICGASRAGLMTGTYPNRIGMHGAPQPTARHGLNSNELTLPEMLKQKGYSTGMTGKWHLGHRAQFLPTEHGFDEYFGIPYSNDMSPTARYGKHHPPLPLYRQDQVVEYEPDQRRFTKEFAEWGLDFIERNQDEPFFLYMANPMPHIPIYASEEFEGSTGKGLYADVITEIDWSVGVVCDKLKELGLEENTIVMFTSDNGPWKVYGDHGGTTGPLSGAKTNVYEGGIRVPFVAKWPARFPSGDVCSEPAMTLDLMPTLSWITGSPMPSHTIDGKNFYSLFTEPGSAQTPHEALYFYFRKNQLQALRSGKWKLILPHTMARSLRSRNGGRIAMYSYERKKYELYDLSVDPGEKVNLFETESDVAARLLELAEEARADMGDSLTRRQGANQRPRGN